MTIKLPLIAALILTSTIASAEPKAPKKPSVFAESACQPVALKGAMGIPEQGTKDGKGWVKDTAMVCTTKSSARVLREWRLAFFGDGDAFIIGR